MVFFLCSTPLMYEKARDVRTGPKRQLWSSGLSLRSIGSHALLQASVKKDISSVFRRNWGAISLAGGTHSSIIIAKIEPV